MPNVQVLSFWCQLFKRLTGETHVFGWSFIFCIFLSNGGVLTRGRPVSVIDHVKASRDYVKVEHVKTSLLNSVFAKFQRF